MERQEFAEVMVFLEGAYARSFTQQAKDVAWGLAQRIDAGLFKRAAVRMVKEETEHPSPAKLMRWVKTVGLEEFEAVQWAQQRQKVRDVRRQIATSKPSQRTAARPRRVDETDEERIAYLKTLIGTVGEDGIATAEDSREFIRLILARPYPEGHLLYEAKGNMR